MVYYKYAIYCITALLQITDITGQDPNISENGLTVVAFKGLNIREMPSVKGKVLTSVPFGGLVEPMSEKISEKIDTIDGIAGNWIKVRFKELEGFAFSPYLVGNLDIIRAKSRDDFILLMEGVPGWTTSFEPDFHYYGLYNRNGIFQWENVNVSFLVACVDGYEKFSDEHCLEDFPNIKIKTDRKERSVLIVGSRKKLDERKILTLIGNPEETYHQDHFFISPERIFTIEYNDINYHLRAYDSIAIDYANRNFEKHYKIQFYTGYFRGFQYSVPQNLSIDLNLYDSGERHAIYNSPVIQWAGDINGDGILDVIFSQNGMVEHGGTFWESVLFIGEKSGNKVLLKRAWSYVIGSCV